MKRTLGTFLGLAMVAVFTFAGAPAYAAKSDCPSGKLCLWHNQNYLGTLFTRTSSDDDLGSNSDEAHSVYNHSNVAWVLYDDKNYSTRDRRFCIKSGRSTADLGSGAYSFGDKISSVSKRSKNTCPSGVPRI